MIFSRYKILWCKLGQMLLYKDKGNSQDVGYWDADWVDSPIEQLFMSGYYVFCGGDSISWESKNHIVGFST